MLKEVEKEALKLCNEIYQFLPRYEKYYITNLIPLGVTPKFSDQYPSASYRYYINSKIISLLNTEKVIPTFRKDYWVLGYKDIAEIQISIREPLIKDIQKHIKFVKSRKIVARKELLNYMNSDPLTTYARNSKLIKDNEAFYYIGDFIVPVSANKLVFFNQGPIIKYVYACVFDVEKLILFVNKMHYLEKGIEIQLIEENGESVVLITYNGVRKEMKGDFSARAFYYLWMNFNRIVHFESLYDFVYGSESFKKSKSNKTKKTDVVKSHVNTIEKNLESLGLNNIFIVIQRQGSFGLFINQMWDEVYKDTLIRHTIAIPLDFGHLKIT